MKAIYQKELKTYLYTATGWLFLSVFLSLGSLIFYLNNLLQRSSDLALFLSMMSYLWVLLCPVLVMRLIAGERRQMTDRLLLSSPVSVFSLVVGKYFAACTLLTISVVISFVFPLVIALYARVYLPELITAYIGFLLQGCAFIALDFLVTSAAKNTASAAALAFGANLFVWLISLMSSSPQVSNWLAKTIGFFSLYDRFIPFLNAQFSPANALFYLLYCLCMLALSTLSLHLQRVRKR